MLQDILHILICTTLKTHEALSISPMWLRALLKLNQPMRYINRILSPASRDYEYKVLLYYFDRVQNCTDPCFIF